MSQTLSKDAMNEQQELYNWLKTEYGELYKQQELIRAIDANAQQKPGGVTAADKEMQVQYQKRFAAYQVKLEKYHKCQKSILESSKSSSSSQKQQSMGAHGTQVQQKAGSSTMIGKSQTKSESGLSLSSSNVKSVNTIEPYTKDARERQHLLTSVNTKFRASECKGISITSNDLRDSNMKGEYLFGYEAIRGSLLKRCMEVGMEQRKGMTLWNEYWNGLRKFLLYRISKAEFDVLLLDELKLPSDVLCLHNCLIGSILANAKSGATARDNVSLLPYLCTNKEMWQYFEKGNAVDSTPDEGSVDQTEKHAFSPLVSRDCIEGVAVQSEAASTDDVNQGQEPDRAPIDVIQIVNRIHGNVLSARPLLKPPPTVPPQQAAKGRTSGAPSSSGNSNSNRKDQKVPARTKVDSKEDGATATSEARPGMRRSRDTLVTLDSGGGTAVVAGESAAKVAKTSSSAASNDDSGARGVSGTRSGLRLAAGAASDGAAKGPERRGAEHPRPRRSTR